MINFKNEQKYRTKHLPPRTGDYRKQLEHTQNTENTAHCIKLMQHWTAQDTYVATDETNGDGEIVYVRTC